MTEERLTIRLAQELRQELHAFAGSSNRSEAKVVREAIALYLKQQEQPVSCHALASRLGILAASEGLPTDLSANKGYFEGFGTT